MIQLIESYSNKNFVNIKQHEYATQSRCNTSKQIILID